MAPTATSTSPMLTLTFTKFPTCKWKQHHLKNQVAEIQGPKRTVNLDFSFLRNSSLATSTPRDIKDFLRRPVPASKTNLRKKLGSFRSLWRVNLHHVCFKPVWNVWNNVWQDFGNGFLSTICHVHMCLEASCGAGFSAGTSMCWSSFKSPPKCDWRI